MYSGHSHLHIPICKLETLIIKDFRDNPLLSFSKVNYEGKQHLQQTTAVMSSVQVFSCSQTGLDAIGTLIKYI